jgi:quercetin dioxygenase-like cupin family protein
MAQVAFPEMIEHLPDIDIQLEGVRGKLLQAVDKQIVFFDLEPIGRIPPHSHGAQWGIVVTGEIELRIGASTRVVRKGDSYYIPAGVEHEARILIPSQVIDIFDDPDRYQVKA